MTVLDTYLRAQSSMSESDIGQVCQSAMPRSLRRNEPLLQEGQICRHKTFVCKGLLRTFGTDDDGTEHILQFAPNLPGHWTWKATTARNQHSSIFVP